MTIYQFTLDDIEILEERYKYGIEDVKDDIDWIGYNGNE